MTGVTEPVRCPDCSAPMKFFTVTESYSCLICPGREDIKDWVLRDGKLEQVSLRAHVESLRLRDSTKS